MTRYIKYTLSVGYCGCDDDGVTSVPDDYDNGDIDMMVNDMANDHAQSWEGDQRLGFDPDLDPDSEEAQEERDNFYDGVGGYWEWATPQNLEDYGVSES